MLLCLIYLTGGAGGAGGAPGAGGAGGIPSGGAGISVPGMAGGTAGPADFLAFATANTIAMTMITIKITITELLLFFCSAIVCFHPLRKELELNSPIF